MAMSNEAQPSLPASAATTVKDNKAAHQKTVWLAQLPAFIIALSALFAVCYLGYTLQQTRQHYQRQTQAFTQQINTLKQQLNDTKSEFALTAQAVQQTQAKLANQFTTLNNHLQTTLSQHFYQKQDWPLLKARYYLELAQINAQWSNEQKTTISLLQQADQVLVHRSEQQLLTIRQTIAQEIANLNAMPHLDRAGLLSQLDAAQHLLLELPLNHNINNMQAAPDGKPPATSAWHQQWNANMTYLQKLVIVRRHDENIIPLLSPWYQMVMRESIRLYLQQAQWAILENDSAVYHNALTQAMQTIQRGFPTNNDGTAALLLQLQSLQKVQFNANKPLLGKSLGLLNQFIFSQSQQLNTASPPAQPGGGS